MITSLNSGGKKKRGTVNYSKYGYFFIFPFVLFYCIFGLYPTFNTLRLAFTDLAGWAVDYEYVGFENFSKLFANQIFRQAFKNTWIIWLLNFFPQLVISLSLAAWFTDIKLRLKHVGFFKVMVYLPNIITAATVAVLFAALFGFPKGPVNTILMNLGLVDEPVNFFRDVWITRGTVSFIQFWQWYGHSMIILIAGILGISPSLYEAARVDGANSIQMFWKITVPLIKPILLYQLITSLIGGMNMFDIPFLLVANGGPDRSVETMATYIYRQAFTGGYNYYMASAASIFLFIFVAIISIVIFKTMRQDEYKSSKRR